MNSSIEDRRPSAPDAEPCARDQQATHHKPLPNADQAEGVLRRVLRAGYGRERARAIADAFNAGRGPRDE